MHQISELGSVFCWERELEVIGEGGRERKVSPKKLQKKLQTKCCQKKLSKKCPKKSFQRGSWRMEGRANCKIKVVAILNSYLLYQFVTIVVTIFLQFHIAAKNASETSTFGLRNKKMRSLLKQYPPQKFSNCSGIELLFPTARSTTCWKVIKVKNVNFENLPNLNLNSHLSKDTKPALKLNVTYLEAVCLLVTLF